MARRSIAADGEAARAGMQIGDRIVKISLGEVEVIVANDKQKVESLLGKAPGSVTLTALRRARRSSAGESIDDIFAEVRGRTPPSKRAGAAIASTAARDSNSFDVVQSL